MSSPLDQLHDIEGLDPISFWPLAIGWWVLIGVGVLLLCGIAYFVVSHLRFKRSWKSDALQKLTILEEHLSDATARDSLIALSEYLRRIALHRFSRNECAGLMGDAWLEWLTLHDSQRFDWENKGHLLVDAPYAPLNRERSAQQIKELIQAVRSWIR